MPISTPAAILKNRTPAIVANCKIASITGEPLRRTAGKVRPSNRSKMDLNTYQRTIKRHAVHGDDYNMPTLPYLLLGLCNEAGEAAGVGKKLYRDAGGRMSAARRDRLADELGDTLWYLARAAQVAGLTLDDVARRNVAKIKQRKAAARLPTPLEVLGIVAKCCIKRDKRRNAVWLGGEAAIVHLIEQVLKENGDERISGCRPARVRENNVPKSTGDARRGAVRRESRGGVQSHAQRGKPRCGQG